MQFKLWDSCIRENKPQLNDVNNGPIMKKKYFYTGKSFCEADIS